MNNMQKEILCKIENHFDKFVVETISARNDTVVCALYCQSVTNPLAIVKAAVASTPCGDRIRRECKAYVTYERLLNREPIFLESKCEEELIFILLKYVPGKTAGQWRKLIQKNYDVGDLVDLCERFIDGFYNFNKVGLLHGDVTPKNIVISDQDECIIDWENVRGMHTRQPYTGGLLHFASPRVAHTMLTGESLLNYNINDEWHALATSVFTIITGDTYYKYSKRDSKNVKLSAIMDCNRRVVDCGIFVNYNDVITDVVNICRSEREFDVEEAYAALRSAGDYIVT